MAPTQLEPLLKGETGRNTRVLLRLIILCTIAGAAVASRLFSVITPSDSSSDSISSTGSSFQADIIAVDPWFNFRATKYLVQHGFYKFWDWFDDSKIIPFLNAGCSVMVDAGYLCNAQSRLIRTSE
ncbi:MAG: hypothetical protein Q9198_007236 [Flavoplaca austrocitrina]